MSTPTRWFMTELHKARNKRRRKRGSPFYIYKLPIDRPRGCYVIITGVVVAAVVAAVAVAVAAVVAAVGSSR